MGLLLNKLKRDTLALFFVFDREREDGRAFPAEVAREAAAEDRKEFAADLEGALNPEFAFDELVRVLFERDEDEFPDFPVVEAIKSFFPSFCDLL